MPKCQEIRCVNAEKLWDVGIPVGIPLEISSIVFHLEYKHEPKITKDDEQINH